MTSSHFYYDARPATPAAREHTFAGTTRHAGSVSRRVLKSILEQRPTIHTPTEGLSLLRGGGDCYVTALLGYEHVETTSVHLRADMQLKGAALVRTSDSESRIRRYRPGDRLLTFLDGL